MIALITPTGARPKQIQLAAEWMRKQTYKGEVLWVLVDDAVPITTDFIPVDFRENWQIIRCYPRPKWEHGQNTQKRNLLVAVNVIEKYDNIEYIFIIEDDDYYTPDYIDTMISKLKGHVAAGQINTVYFNIGSGTMKIFPNKAHSSLFQTAIHFSQLPMLKRILTNDAGKFIDIRLWKELQNSKINLFNGDNLSIGIKGLPGRAGIGIGHRMKGREMSFELKKQTLKKLIGDGVFHYLELLV